MSSGSSPGSPSGSPRARRTRRSTRVRPRGLSTVVALGVIAALGFSAFGARTAAGVDADSSISGRVLASDTQAPLEGVVVHLYDPDPLVGFVRGVETTDDDGRFHFDVPAGSYTVIVNPGAWSLPSADDGIPYLYSAQGHAVALGEGGHATLDTTLAAVNRASISGTITDADTGAPVAGVVVSASSIPGGGSAVTGEDGTYTIPLLPAAEHTVHFDGSAIGYGTGWWNTDEWDAPGSLEVGFNEAVTGIDGQLGRERVTWTARYHDPRKCELIGQLAAAVGVDTAEVLRHGTDAFRSLARDSADASWAASGGTLPEVVTPAGPPACEIDVSWDASEAASLEAAAAWWGVSVEELHEGGGWLVVVVAIQAAMRAAKG